jgi:hypothetical protein
VVERVEAEAGLAAVVAADVTNRSVVMFLVACKTCNGEKTYAANKRQFRQISLGKSS